MQSTRRIRFIVFFLLNFFLITALSATAPDNAADINVRIHPLPGTVALTFDDGPSPKYTQQILAILDRYHIKATFFMMGGFVKKYPELARDIVAHGHVVANHTMTHPFLTHVPENRLNYEIVQSALIIEKVTGRKPLCLRPPFGLSNTLVRNYIRAHGMQVVMWDLNSFDYQRQPVPHLIHWVLSQTRSGYDILMHDGSGNSFQTVQALPAIIEGFQKKGFGFSVICDNRKTTSVRENTSF